MGERERNCAAHCSLELLQAKGGCSTLRWVVVVHATELPACTHPPAHSRRPLQLRAPQWQGICRPGTLPIS